MEKCCVVLQAPFYQEKMDVHSVFKTRKAAEKSCRENGFRWSNSEHCFLNSKLSLYRELRLSVVKDK